MKEYDVYSPLPGVFYRQPAPEMPPFTEEGDNVQEDTVIGLIEVMKQFTEMVAGHSGKLIKFNVESGDPIEPGQVIAIIKSDR
ncbi:acetyl-CoA carboxylase biotin carboxyl carrier protein subunit [Lonsdalea iberica]|uniref:Biotin carboxyl carrier protein of acetyl-CoA carboxylase n=1 Tax=Lonsdalea iberica TaxID=1082703 RepID=A0A1X3RZC4_9GAMM|nr:acetyl-CoA carboxylase [Lonsdalea iberica]OSN07428.1 acetyl-CoA carboxylase biotin carboxyl carrier protein subunit [Lonsdalea iberica]OSN11325.1 acetyl-CoA carboxylase biotin carboxyl carrier protein subunit [Lonsdalea iberica]